MSEVPEVIQSLFDNRLDMLLPKRDPAFVGQYSIGNRLVNSLAHMVGTDGVASHLVAADRFGNLRSRIVDTAGKEAKISAYNNLQTGIWNQDNLAVVTVAQGVSEYGELGLEVSDYYEREINNILDYNCDPVFHWVKVHQIP